MTAIASEGRGWLRVQPHQCKVTDMNKGNATDVKAESRALERYRRVVRHMPNTKPHPHNVLGEAKGRHRKTII